MRELAVLRPEPGNAATCARIAATGGTALPLPLFQVAALEWVPPDPARFDALVLTSANAVRHAGPALDAYAKLPVFAVGAASAAAARAAGLAVTATGAGDALALEPLLRDHGVVRAIHLTGRDQSPTAPAGIAATVAVYASERRAIDPAAAAGLNGTVALVHSARAGARLAELVAVRGEVRIAAISAAALAASGNGWDKVAVAARPDDAALIAAALALAA